MTTPADTRTPGILGWIERTGNKLPDPVFIFFALIGVLIVVSVLMSLLGVSALHPTQVGTLCKPATRQTWSQTYSALP